MKAPARTTKKQSDQKILIYILIGLLILMAGGLAWALFARGSQVTSLLYTQQAKNGSFRPVENQKGVYMLTLEHISPQTVFFSDRPKRISGTQSTETFIKSGLFIRSNPPNAAIVISNPVSGDSDVVIAELSSPKYDQAKEQLSYQVKVLGETPDGLKNWEADKDTQLPANFDHVSLFIDNGAPLDQGGDANVNVTVKDVSGAPVAGAEVALFGTSGSTPSHTTTTDKNGLASFNGIYPGDALRQEYYRVVVTKSGYKDNADAKTNACANETDSVAITLIHQ